MAVSMNEFLPTEVIKACGWLGRHNWVRFEHPDNRWIISTNKQVFEQTPVHERATPKFQAVRGLLHNPYKSDKELLLTYALSRSVAFGPKIFQPTDMQCRALENTGCDVPFDQYAQPYETLLIKFPEKYRQFKLGEMSKCPKYVISWYDRAMGLILVGCQFHNFHDRIVGILNVTPTQTIEEALSAPIYYEADGTVASDVEDFKIAQLFERIAINLNMLMMYGGSKLVLSHHNKLAWERHRELKKRYERQRNKARLAEMRDWSVGQLDEIHMDQEIGFKVQPGEMLPPHCQGGTHASPKAHWRRGHWARQHFGTKNSLVKVILRPPVYVVGQTYKGVAVDLEQTSVVYKQEGNPWQGQAPEGP